VATNRHLPALAELPDVSLKLIWSRRVSKAQRVAQQFQIPLIARQWEEVCDSPDVDAVVVATPPILHCEATTRALQAGKHVLCQGRMARNLKEALTMIEAAGSSGRVAALYPPRPGLKGDRVMKRLLHEQDFVGEIREVRVSAMSLAETNMAYSWKRDPDVVGVNAMTLGMWSEVLNRWAPLPRRLVAFARLGDSQRIATVEGMAGTQVPGSIAALSELENGASAMYHFSDWVPFGPSHSIEIHGTRGVLLYKLFQEEIFGASEGSKQMIPIPVPPGDERQHTTDAEFIAAIQNGGCVSPDFSDGVRYMEFCEAVALSAHSCRIVDLPLRQPAMASWGKSLEVTASQL
jgi:predicted dehydrogenase